MQGSKFKDKFIKNIENSRKLQRTNSPCSLYTRNQEFDEEEYLKADLIHINKEEAELQKELAQIKE